MSDEAPKQNITWEISPKSIFLILGIISGIWIGYLLLDVLISLFIAVIVTAALAPAVQYLQTKFKLPFGLTILIVYSLTIAFIVGLGYLVFPPLVSQVGAFINALPRFLTSALQNFGLLEGEQSQQFQMEVVSFISSRIGDFAQGAYSFTISIFGAVLGLVSTMVFSFYLLVEKQKVEEFIATNLPFIKHKKRRELMEVINLVEVKLGAWARGQLALCLIIGVLTYVVLLILGVPFALPLAVIAGVLEIIPVIGPIISAIPALLIVIAFDPFKALIVALAFIIIQQLENSLIVPQVMSRAVGFSPLISILAIMVGSSLMGIAGALLAIPFLAITFVIIEFYSK